MGERVLLVFALIFFSIFILLVKEAKADTPVSDCYTFTTPGTYYLTQNLPDRNPPSYCMNISASNVILDCQGYTIDGVGLTYPSQSYGIYISGRLSPYPQLTNITVKNCTLTDWVYGLYVYLTNSSIFTNINSSFNNYCGVYFYRTINNIIANSSLSDNIYLDFYISGIDGGKDCNQVLYNVNGTDNKPIAYYNYSVKIQNWNNNVSEIVLCNANNSVIDNVRMIRTGTKNNGIRLVINNNTNISNTYLANLGAGIQLITVYNNRLTNITSNSNSWAILFGSGIYTASVYSTTFTNITAISNLNGFYLSSSYSNNITNSKIQDSSLSGINMTSTGSPANLIYNNLFNNTLNVYFFSSIKNNYWNTSIQTGTRIYSNGPYIGGNYWTNSTANDYSDTCNDTNRDSFCDNLYIVKYTATTNNTDYLPLSNKADVEPPKWSSNSTNNTIAGKNTLFSLKWTDNFQLDSYIFSLDNCAGSFQNITQRSLSTTGNWSNETYVISSTAYCTVKWRYFANDSNNNWNVSEFSFTTLPSYCDYAIPSNDATYTINQNNKYYCLEGNKKVLGKNTVNFNSGVINSTLDCLGYNLDSNNIAGTYGVYLTGTNTKNNTVKNCKITNFQNGVYLYNGPNNNTLINNTVSSNTNGFFLYSSSNNNLTNNIVNGNSNGTRLDTNSNNNILTNNTVKGNTQYGLYIYSSSNNDIKNGSILDNTNGDYYLSSAGSTNNFTATNFTSLRKIYFNDVTSWFDYRNDTGDIWLKTNVSVQATITRKLTSWIQTLMQWNDSASSITAGYNLTGLKTNTWYVVYNNAMSTYVLKTDSVGTLPSFSINLNSEHEIKVREEYLIIDSVEIKPPTDPGRPTIDPQENSTVNMNVTVNITNSTSLDKCAIRVFSPLDSYTNPTFNLSGTIQIVNSRTQCFGNWIMEYWRTPGGCDVCLPAWNVSVYLNLTVGLSNFTSNNFNYSQLPSATLNVSTINFTGLPGQYVISDNAFPLKIENRGNVYVNISVNGTDFDWETYPSPKIGVGNISYNESGTGNFRNLTHVYSLSNPYLAPTETGYLYYKANVPIGFRAQRYNNTIEHVTKSKATEVCNICYKFVNGACQAQTTSLGANLYGCEGSNKKCDNGNCSTGQPRQPDNNWYNATQNDKTYRPPARKRHAMTYAPDYDKVLMFGGDDPSYRNDTWIFNYTDLKWYNVTKSGSPPWRGLIGNSMDYDTINRRVILFGGYNGSSNYYGDTWEFNFTDERWYNRKPSVSPPPRDWANVVYMSAHDRIILHGGYNGTYFSDTWEYNYTENKWYNITKNSCTPPVRSLDWMTYDSDNDRIIKFGGTVGTTYFNDTWIFNYTDSCWYNVTNPRSPPTMDSHSMAYDSESKLTILHGGQLRPLPAPIINQTWAFNYTSKLWSNITNSAGTIPTAINDHSLVYIGSTNDRIIRFGGQIIYNGPGIDETWIFNYTKGG